MRKVGMVLAACAALSACTVEKTATPVAYERPQDVKTLFIRADGCQHWAGEEAYDRTRAKAILQAVHRLRCETLDNDYTRLRQKYARDTAVSDDMEIMNQNYGFELLPTAR